SPLGSTWLRYAACSLSCTVPLSIPPPPPTPTLFPYTTLFRSAAARAGQLDRRAETVPRRGRLDVRTRPLRARRPRRGTVSARRRSEEHTSELQSPYDLVCRLLLEKKKKIRTHSLRRLYK